MLNARQFQQHEIECHLKSGRFKIYMAVWSIFLAVVIAASVYDNSRTASQGSDTHRQSAELTTTLKR
jgi:hypothetical protein